MIALLACAEEPLPTGEAGLERADLGKFETDADGAAKVPFTAPDAGVSVLVGCGPYDYDHIATAALLTDPGGAAVYDWEDDAATAMRVGTLVDFLTVLLPVSPDLDVTPGDYTMDLLLADAASGDAAQGTVACQSVTRIQEVADAQTVDVNLVFVGVDDILADLDDENAPGSQVVQDTLAEFGALIGEAGLSVGDVSYADFDGAVETYTVIEGEEEFGDLLKTVSTDHERAITFFFVEDIELEAGVSIVGLAGGPPGAAAIGGTSKSGVIVSVAGTGMDPATVGLVMAHESGHFMGLFHTTEKDGERFDPLSDTSEGDGGRDNVMYWLPTAGEATEMTADQGWVVRRSAAVY